MNGRHAPSSLEGFLLEYEVEGEELPPPAPDIFAVAFQVWELKFRFTPYPGIFYYLYFSLSNYLQFKDNYACACTHVYIFSNMPKKKSWQWRLRTR